MRRNAHAGTFPSIWTAPGAEPPLLLRRRFDHADARHVEPLDGAVQVLAVDHLPNVVSGESMKGEQKVRLT